jgi:hypothetical protein
VTTHVVALCVSNLLMLVAGAGLLPVMRLARTPREVLVRLPLAYAVGLAATGIAAANLALIHVPVGRFGLTLLAAAAVVIGARQLKWGVTPAARHRSYVAAAVLVVIAVYFANAARLFTVKPLLENDGWALWGVRARALYEFGHPVAPVFTASWYSGLQYPLFLPELEAIDFRFMGAFDGTVVHLQLLGLAIAFVGGAWSLLRDHARPLVLAIALLAIVTAPMFFGQLETNDADVPAAMMVALGIAALAAWLRSDQKGLLPAAVVFLAAGALTKNEGEVFVLAAFIAALAAAHRLQHRPLLIAFGVTAALVLPWHIWLLAHHVTATTWSLSHLLHPHYLTSHWYRVDSAQHQLIVQIQRSSSWSRLSLVAAAGVAAALLLRNNRVLAFAVGWLLLCFGGLLLVYWSSPLPLHPDLFSSADRTIDTLVIGGVVLVPLLVGTEPQR